MKITILAPIEIEINGSYCGEECDYTTQSNFCNLFDENCETKGHDPIKGYTYECCDSCLNATITKQ